MIVAEAGAERAAWVDIRGTIITKLLVYQRLRVGNRREGMSNISLPVLRAGPVFSCNAARAHPSADEAVTLEIVQYSVLYPNRR